ncbi:LCP family protein [Enterococcus faecium]|nr:LCP family protein [Enterococcus faecium]
MYKILKVISIFLLMFIIAASAYGVSEYMKLQNLSEVSKKAATNMNVKYSADVATHLPDRFNVLLLGVDTGEFGRTEKGRSDSMIAAHVNLKNETVKLISLERDTYVQIAGKNSFDKLNAAYAYGGEQTAIQTTENMLHTTIPYYMTMNMKGLESMLSIVGDIEVVNDFAFNFDHYDFPKGSLTLSPEEALAWSRMRYDDPNGDYGRQIRQQKVIKAIMQKLLTMESIPKIDKIINVLGNNMKTNLPLGELFKLYLTKSTKFKMSTDQLKGEEEIIDGISYQKMTDTEIKRISQQLQ